VLQQELQILEVALSNRFLSRKQGDVIRELLAASPAVTAAELMVQRHYVTEAQVTEILSLAGLGESGPAPIEETVRTASPPTGTQQNSPTAPPPQPGRQLSIADLKAGNLSPNMRNAPAAAGREGGASPPPAAGAPVVSAAPSAPVAAPPPAAAPPPRSVATAAVANQPKTLAGLLRLARHWGASDLHLSVNRPPFVRIYGQIRYMESEPLTSEMAEELNFSGLTDEQKAVATDKQQIDFSLEVPGIGRHRCNVFKQRLGWDGAYRIVRATVPTLAELGLPAHLTMFTEYHQGLVMLTGGAGAGKTTTAAAMLDIVNGARKDHIITVEDPIEYILPPKQCQVMQREVGPHTQSFANALRAALREDPDIILVGEMRDLETTSISISASETGHLVFSTMPTSSAARTVARIVDFYPIAQQSQVQTMVAESLRGVITQLLFPRRDGKGCVIAAEILVNNSGIAQQIKEGKTHMITSLIQSGKKAGMALMDDSIMGLLTSGQISGREAYRRASNKNAFEANKDQD
jgi:twitching motility protein PilT